MRVALPALALIALAACQEDAPTPAADPLAPLGSAVNWRITEIAGAAVPEGIRVTMLSPEPGVIAGSSGCNRYSGRIETRDGALHVGALAGTRMMCPPEQMQVEQAFHSTIGTVTALRLAGPTLDFTDAAGKVVLRAAR